MTKRERAVIRWAKRVVEEHCVLCDCDEAEGDLINHCEACCRRITTELYGLFVYGFIPQKPRAALKKHRRKP